MGKLGSTYLFEDESPTVDQLHEAAETLGGQRIKRGLTHGCEDLEFECFPGKVKLSTYTNGFGLMSHFGEAPVLHDLLGRTLEQLGGQSETDGGLFELQLPLTEEFIESTTAEFRRDLGKKSRLAGLALIAIILAGVGLLAALAWAVRAIWS